MRISACDIIDMKDTPKGMATISMHVSHDTDTNHTDTSFIVRCNGAHIRECFTAYDTASKFYNELGEFVQPFIFNHTGRG